MRLSLTGFDVYMKQLKNKWVYGIKTTVVLP